MQDNQQAGVASSTGAPAPQSPPVPPEAQPHQQPQPQAAPADVQQPAQVYGQTASPGTTVPPAAGAPAHSHGFPQAPVQVPQDNSFWVKLLIFFNPLASVIWYFLKRDTDPVLAKRGFKTAWFSVAFWTIVLFVLMAFYLFAGFMFILSEIMWMTGSGGW
ncbi:MAG: DUF4870 domain-containing protein [Coriobacteriia bacterium]|nr:DUF4870 domain-containing protein [Coriobacteriia bacterium]MCL2745710.1 DUF4870 domain-containing protein [Coriobacteriia bacterium]MCL2870243.1 DUF4870 domain-containing protein [Coriobacteriia bacterium]